MKKIMTLSILILVAVMAQMIVFFPWWSFLLPIFLLGLTLPLQKWKILSFQLGFVAGFLVWAISSLYFEIIYDGDIMNKISKAVAPNYSIGAIILVHIIIGFFGGILTGLSFYSGFLLRKGKEILHLELPEN